MDSRVSANQEGLKNQTGNMPEISISMIVQALGSPYSNVARAWPLLYSAMCRMGISHPLIQVGLAATIAVESRSWLPVAEGRAFPGTRIWKLQERYWPSGYFGRGLIQITWESNYRAVGQRLGIPLVEQPHLALEIENACLIAVDFFKTSGAAKACLTQDWVDVRRRVNGPGLVHLDLFRNYVERLREVARV